MQVRIDTQTVEGRFVDIVEVPDDATQEAIDAAVEARVSDFVVRVQYMRANPVAVPDGE